jgi:ribonuclease BN (tRNA processing enzyme)
MELTLLGTGCGIPQSERNSPAALLKINRRNILLDSGSGTIRQLLKLKITYTDIDYILYSHFHVDHINDLACLLFACKYPAIPRRKDLVIIGPLGIENFYHKLIELYKNQLDAQQYKVQIKEMQTGSSYEFKEFEVKSQLLKHMEEAPSLAYKIIVKKQNKVLVYAGDTELCQELIDFLVDADAAVLECSFPLKVKGHLCPEDIELILSKTNCKKLILSHFYPVWDKKKLQRLKYMDKRIIVGYDLEKIKI